MPYWYSCLHHWYDETMDYMELHVTWYDETMNYMELHVTWYDEIMDYMELHGR